MAVYPTPTGAAVGFQLPAPYSGPAITQSSSIAQVAAYLDYQGKNGAAYTTWAKAAIAKDPSLTPYNAAVAWLAGTGIGGDVAVAVGGTGTATDQIGQGGTNGLENVEKQANAIPGLVQIGDFFGALAGANLWIRAAKVIFGGVLLIVGIVHITGVDNAVAKIARKVPLPV